MKTSFCFTADNSQFTDVYDTLVDAAIDLGSRLLETGETRDDCDELDEFTCCHAVDADGRNWYAVLPGHSDRGTNTDREGARAFLQVGGDAFGDDHATHFDADGRIVGGSD